MTQQQQQPSKTGKNVFTIITEKIIEQLQNGKIPWRCTWHQAGIPSNLVTQRPYKGLNLMLLSSLGYERNLFLSSKQINDIGASIKADEKPHMVTSWNYEDSSKPETQGKKPTLSYYTVFNIAQCNGIPENLILPNLISEFSVGTCEEVLHKMSKQPVVTSKDARCFYDPISDSIHIPKQKDFKDKQEYYSAFFHQLVHSTGHHSRLYRKEMLLMPEIGYDGFSLEELIAEIGTCYLESYGCISFQTDEPQEYFDGWIKAFGADERLVFTASLMAHKAVNYILNITE